LGEILYLSLSTAGVRETPFLQPFGTFLTIKKILHRDLSEIFQMSKAIYVVIIKHNQNIGGDRTFNREIVKNRIFYVHY